MKRAGSESLGLILLATLAGIFLWMAWQLSPVASLIPRFVLSGLLALLLFESGRLLWRQRRGSPDRAGRSEGERPGPGEEAVPDGPRSSLWRALAWIVPLPVAFGVLGPVAGSAAYCAAFLRWRSGESWRYSLAYAAILGLLLAGATSWVYGEVAAPGLLFR